MAVPIQNEVARNKSFRYITYNSLNGETGPLQGLYLHRKRHHRKPGTYFHARDYKHIPLLSLFVFLPLTYNREGFGSITGQRTNYFYMPSMVIPASSRDSTTSLKPQLLRSISVTIHWSLSSDHSTLYSRSYLQLNYPGRTEEHHVNPIKIAGVPAEIKNRSHSEYKFRALPL
jgi:hypothetical protein